MRVKAERRNKNAAGLTPRDYPVRWVHFSRLMFQPVSSLTSNPRAQRSAATGDVKTLLGNELSPRQEDIRHAATAGRNDPACVTDGPTRPTDRVDVIVINHLPTYF